MSRVCLAIHDHLVGSVLVFLALADHSGSEATVSKVEDQYRSPVQKKIEFMASVGTGKTFETVLQQFHDQANKGLKLKY